MERLKKRYNDSMRALGTLSEILGEPYSIIVRDASIQRFEYTFEAMWKFVKEYLKEKEGIIANSPKSCFRELLSAGILDEHAVVQFLEMTDSRNDTSHTYKEEVANMIFSLIPGYTEHMGNLLKKLQGKL